MEGTRWLHVERVEHAGHRTEACGDVRSQRHDDEVRIDTEDDEDGDDRRVEVTV